MLPEVRIVNLGGRVRKGRGEAEVGGDVLKLCASNMGVSHHDHLLGRNEVLFSMHIFYFNKMLKAILSSSVLVSFLANETDYLTSAT